MYLDKDLQEQWKIKLMFQIVGLGGGGAVILLFRFFFFFFNLVSLAFKGLCTQYIKNGICKERYNGKSLD